MATRNILVNAESFQGNINSFEDSVNRIAELFESISNQMQKVDGTNELWKSKVAVNMHNDYIVLEKKFEEINVELQSYVVFLKNVLESYEKQENNIDTAIEDNSSLLDVNE
jgi:uncharacterized protein YukE